MAKNMESSVRAAFPEANLVTDRFHVVKLAMESLQHLRIKQRWIEIDKENKAIEESKKKGVKYKPIELSNGDSTKQLLAKERFKKWIEETFEEKLETFYTTANTVKANFDNILNFFNNRNTNANAESFNAKIKLFRANLRVVTDTAFFLFRLNKLFA